MAETDNNIFSQAVGAVKNISGSPLGLSVLLAGGVGGLAALARKPLIQTGASLIRSTPGLQSMTGMSRQDVNQAADDLEESPQMQYGLPIGMAGLAAAAALMSNWNSARPWGGLTSWYGNPLSKRSAEYEVPGYQPDIDFSKVINARDAVSMFSNNPYLAVHDPYARNMAVSSIASAAGDGNTKFTTLGNVFDATKEKMNTKLTFEGVSNTVLKTTAANLGATLFTDILGKTLNLSPLNRERTVDAVTWGTLISSIFN